MVENVEDSGYLDDGIGESDIRIVRCNAHRSRIGLSLKQLAARNDHDGMERQRKLVARIRRQFKMKECCQFVLKNEAKGLCFCGAIEAEHLITGPLNGSSRISSASHRQKRPSVWDVREAMGEADNTRLSIASMVQQRLQAVGDISNQSLNGSIASSSQKVYPIPDRVPDATEREEPANEHSDTPSTHRDTSALVAEVGAPAQLPNVPMKSDSTNEHSESTSMKRDTSALVADVGAPAQLPSLPGKSAEQQPPNVPMPPMPLLNVVGKQRHVHMKNDGVWNETTAIREFVTNSFGKIEFSNDEVTSTMKPAKYIRISDTTPVEQVLDLMVEEWRIAEPFEPSLTISVIGGAKNFKLDGRKRSIFNDGLVKAAQSTNAWIITSGVYTGVMRAVGEAVQEGQSIQVNRSRVTHSLRCIGIAPWGYVANRHELTNVDGQGCWPASYYADPVARHGQPVSLDPHHTHFVLVDDGHRSTFRPKVADYRAKLEQHIAGRKNKSSTASGIPVVVVLVEGGADSIDFACESIKCRIPLVVCKGTGRAADIIAYAFEEKHGNSLSLSSSVTQPPDAIDELLYKMLLNAYGPKDGLKDKIKQIHKCVADEALVTIFDTDAGRDFDLVILSALLKGKGARPVDQLKLALKWNRPDVAEEKIFTTGVTLAENEMAELMTEALVENKQPFVRLLIQHGVVMKDYLTVLRLRRLYNAARHGSFLSRLLSDASDSRQTFFLCDVKKVLERLLGSQFDPTYELDRVEVPRQMSKRQKEIAIGLGPMISSALFPKPFRELFIWAVLIDRPLLARFFWERGQSPVMDALLATKLYDRLGRYIGRDNHELRAHFRHWKSEFQSLAIQVVNRAFSVDIEKTLVIIERPHKHCNFLNCQQMAAQADCKRFIATQACQMSVEEKWTRGLKIASSAQVFVGLLMPLYVMFWLRFNSYSIGVAPGQLSIMHRLRIFYAAPVTKFCSNLMSHVLFITLYTYVLMFDIRRDHMSVAEVVLHVWTLSHLITFLREMLTLWISQHLLPLKHQYEVTKFGVWNRLECFSLVFHAAAFTMRLICVQTDTWMQVIRLLLCLANAFFYIKLFRFYVVSSYLGPKLFVIRRMFHDVFMFLMILIVVMLSYATAAQALLYPDREFYWGIFRDVLYYPYWQMYGELNLEDTIQGSRSGCDAGQPQAPDGTWCPRSFWPVSLMLAAYLLVSNILLVNLLIAMFTHVFEEAVQNSNEIWKHEMYQLAVEFDNKPFCAPPLNIPENVIGMFVFVLNVCRQHSRHRHVGRKDNRQHNQHQQQQPPTDEALQKFQLSPQLLEQLQIFERECMCDYLRSAEEVRKHEIQNRVETIEQQLETLNKRSEESNRRISVHLERLQTETATKLRTDTARSLSKMIREVELRLKTLERWSSVTDTERQKIEPKESEL